MPNPSLIRVRPVDLHWEVLVEGAPRRMVDRLCTKERAIEHARAYLREGAILVVERRDGTVEVSHAA